MGLETYLRFMAALVVVVALIALAAWAVRRFGWGTRFVAAGGKRRLAVLEVLPMDGKRRLVLLRCDQREHLVLLGAERDLLIESERAAGAEGSGEFRNLLAKSGT